MIQDALLTPELRGSTLWLVDLDGERLEVMAAYARRLNDLLDAGLYIRTTTHRAEALPAPYLPQFGRPNNSAKDLRQ